MDFYGNLRQDSDFSQWYVAHRPPHSHIWHCSQPGCLLERNFIGLPLVLTLLKRHPILNLSTSQELQFVLHADETTLVQFFDKAGSSDRVAQFRAAEMVRNALSQKKLDEQNLDSRRP
jgi:hypothetical protein